MIENTLVIGLTLGMILTLLIYKILYHIFWYKFKKIGKKHNLLTIRCSNCSNYFYINNFETTKLCSNCISLEVD